MAKRRNAPALFELLRESNSTRTGQVGNEDMRAQIGAGVVKNAAPRPPGHPAVIAEAKAAEQAKLDTLKAEQQAEEASAQAKLNAKVAADSSGGTTGHDRLEVEIDSLMSMPEFKAGRAVEKQPEPAQVVEPKGVVEAKPAAAESRTEVKAEPKSSPEPETQPEQSAPKSAGIVSMLSKNSVKPKKQPKPEEPKAASMVDVTSEIESKPTRETKPEPKSEQKPAVKNESETSSKAATKPTEPSVPEKADPPTKQPAGQQIKVGGNQIELTPVKLGILGAFILLLFFAMFVVGSWAGRSEVQREQEPKLREEAERSLQNIGGETGQDDRLVDPLQLAQDTEFVPPSVGDSTQLKPEQPAILTPEPAAPEEIANEDTRIAGQNYLHLAPLADSEEARRLQIFLAENGIQTYIRVGPRSGRTIHELITLVGIPSEGWSTSTEKLSHVREIRRLGGIWFNEHGGSIDYSRANQSQWYKAPPR